MTDGKEMAYSAISDAAKALKSHDKIFQNVRSNLVYWGNHTIRSEVVPMPFLQTGKAFAGENEDQCCQNVDKFQEFEKLCGYLKLYHARCRCVMVFLNCTYTAYVQSAFRIHNKAQAMEYLNPFLKYRMILITADKMVTGSELMLYLVRSQENTSGATVENRSI